MKEDSLKNKAYRYIKDKIINCDYEPGDFLEEKQLIQEINASRTPIREALNKLEQENLIQILPKKGVIVTNISFKNVVEIYQIRELIEPTSIIYNSNKFKKQILLDFKSKFESPYQNPDNIYEDDDSFHRYIISCYDNSYINKIMDEIRSQNQRIRILSGRSEDKTINYTTNEHVQIINNLLEGKFVLAAEDLKKHIFLSKERTMEFLKNITVQ